jgi:hypothetical protein
MDGRQPMKAFGIAVGACNWGRMSGSPSPVTVVMPVYNALPYLDEAIDSILRQTFTDFRLAIYDDRSTDGSYERALEWAGKDARVSVTRGTVWLGPCASSNAAAALATSELVARMDADDVAAPDRLEAELAAFAQFPDAVLIGSTFDMIDGYGRIMWKAQPGRTGGGLPPIAHPTIIYRRAAFEAVGGYRVDTDYFEDHDLYRRIARQGPIVVVNRPLLKIRFAGQHARLSHDPEAVLNKINRHYVERDKTGAPVGRLSPMTFYSIAVLAMLCSRRPRLFGLMLRKASFARPALALTVTAIVGLAELSPWFARQAWLAATAIRGLFETKAESDAEVYLWKPTLRPAPEGKTKAAPAGVTGAA